MVGVPSDIKEVVVCKGCDEGPNSDSYWMARFEEFCSKRRYSGFKPNICWMSISQYCGRVVHRFVHSGKILKPVLNECVAPVTCYWSLALILREET